MRKSLKKKSGFTILEVVIVLAIVGIISAVAMSTISMDIDDIKVDEQLNVLKAHLRYAQAKAMNSDSNWGITFDTANSSKYWLFKGEDHNTKISLPGEEKKLGDEDKTVIMNNVSIDLGSILTTSSGENFVAFNTLGTPVDADEKSVLNNDIEIKRFGTNVIIITITKNTGFIL